MDIFEYPKNKHLLYDYMKTTWSGMVVVHVCESLCRRYGTLPSVFCFAEEMINECKKRNFNFSNIDLINMIHLGNLIIEATLEELDK